MSCTISKWRGQCKFSGVSWLVEPYFFYRLGDKPPVVFAGSGSHRVGEMSALGSPSLLVPTGQFLCVLDAPASLSS